MVSSSATLLFYSFVGGAIGDSIEPEDWTLVADASMVLAYFDWS